VVRYTFIGTLEPSAYGIQGRPRPITMGGVSILRIADGQIVESWDYDEFAQIMLDLTRAAARDAPMMGTPAP
jgi:hypothetical protein